MLSYSKYVKALSLLFASALLCGSSCSSKSSDAPCTPGAEFCPCDSNGGCNSGLTCATNLNECVSLVSDGTGGSASGGTTGEGGSAEGGTTGSGGAKGGSTGSGGNVSSGGTTGSGGSAAGGATGTGGAKGGSTGSGGTASGGATGTGGAKGGSTGSGGTGSGGSSTGGTTGSGGSGSTSCGTLGPSANGNGSFTHYNFGQGTAHGELGDYQTACGYLGTESGTTDTVMNIANTSPAKNTYFAAIPGDGSFNTSGNCGACVQITGANGKTIIATIIDECPESSNPICQQNPNGELDLSVDAFNQLGYSTGNPSGTSWKVVPCPVTGNVVVRIKQANEVYIENVILPLKTVSGPGGNASRTSYGSWHFNSNVGSGASLTLTDSAGRMISVTLNSGSVDQNQDTGKQFPTCQ
ncbi:MAG TPA: hypothetical protein VKZ18_10705 [Polyangia bacterium]|nr:hypothetical protein [Polyangia bacterium]